ncbi:heterokaryon incompatibility protein-domain-containing protein [Leptodontidium sp. 2 PMI_412]|nr:heterokaryon incompatibility protein-domain-containing protein [Leptodontidium sp. 2 PMI_412]
MAANPDNTFIYEPLPSATCVRLIELNQRRQPNGEISFTLHTFELNSAPPFDALSYTWGDPACPYLSSTKISVHFLTAVCCNGAKLEVQPNLAAAFKELQIGDLSRTTYIWIDAICIDQGNPTERSSQVQMMATLYEQAELVIVWLGPEDGTVSDAFMALERLGSIGRVPRSKQQLEEARAAVSHISPWDFCNASHYPTKLGIEPINDRQWLSVAALLHRPYFKRVWVIQEISQARKIVLACGRRRLDWGKLSAALMFLLLTNWYHALHTELLNGTVTDPKARVGFETMLAAKADGGTAAMQLVRTREYALGELGKFRLEDLLSTHRSCLATDPRDKIYSLLGISNFDKPPFSDPEKAQCLVADYQLPVEILYTRVMRLLTESRGDLKMLRNRESNRERSLINLPSWVPDFSVWLIPGYLPGEKFWRANGHWARTSDGRNYDDDKLEVQGQFLGVIEACSIPPFDVLQTPIWGSIAEVARGLPDYYQSFHSGCTSIKTETRIEALARTCIADTLGSQTPAPPDLLCSQFMNRVARLCGTGYNSAYNSTSFSQTCERIGEGDISDSADYVRQTELVTGYRIVFRTNNQMLGVGPVDSREGDEAWILAGLSEPVVLRSNQAKPQHVKTREFIGVAYIHGVMHGEVAGSGLPKENIVLQ